MILVTRRAFMDSSHVADEALAQVYGDPANTHDVETCAFTNEQVAEVQHHVDACKTCQHAVNLMLQASTGTSHLTFDDVKDTRVIRPDDCLYL